MIAALKQMRGRVWVALLAGALLVSFSFAYRYVKQETERVRRLTQTRRELQALIREVRQQSDLLALRVQTQVQPPAELLNPWLEKQQLAIGEPAVQSLPAGYRRHRVRVELSGVPQKELTQLLKVTENAEPAWHVRELSLRPLNGLLQGELWLEALDKSASAP